MSPTPNRPMAVRVRFVLRSGLSSSITMLASSTCAAIITLQDLYGLDLRLCSARPEARP